MGAPLPQPPPRLQALPRDTKSAKNNTTRKRSSRTREKSTTKQNWYLNSFLVTFSVILCILREKRDMVTDHDRSVPTPFEHASNMDLTRMTKGASMVARLVGLGQDVLVGGSLPVDELFLQAMYFDRETNGKRVGGRRYRLLRLMEVMNSVSTAQAMCSAVSKRLRVLHRVGNVILFISDFDLLPMILKSPEVFFEQEEAEEVRRLVKQTIDLLRYLLVERSITCVAYCNSKRAPVIIQDDHFASLFQRFVQGD